MSEMQRYLAFDHGAVSVSSDGEVECIDAIKFWSEHGKDFPSIAKLALRVLSVPCSSAAVERLFSHGDSFSDHIDAG